MIVNHILHRKGLYSANQLHQMITVGGYIPIASPEDLDKIRSNVANTFGGTSPWRGTYVGGLDKKYVQIEHIDLALVDWEPIGSRTNFFTGIYNGNRLRIDKCKVTGSIEDSGLFGGCDNSTVRNCIFVDFDIYSSNLNNASGVFAFSGENNLFENLLVVRSNFYSVASKYGNGGLFGMLQYYNTIMNCHTIDVNVYTEVALINVNNYTGGLIGILLGTGNAISKCSTSGFVTSKSTIASSATCGGFIAFTGTAGSSYVNDCISYSNVEGYQSTAGFIGFIRNRSVITNCASVGVMTGVTAGFCSENYYGVLINSYFDEETAANNNATKGIPRTTAQMKEGIEDSIISDETIYTSWSPEIWDFGDINSYPQLKKIYGL